MSPKHKASKASSKLDKFRHKEREAPGEDGGASTSDSEPPAAETERMLEVISTCLATVTAKIKEVKVDISLLSLDFHKLRHRMSEAETRIDRAED